MAEDAESLIHTIEDYFSIVKEEIGAREDNCSIRLTVQETGDFEALTPAMQDKLLYMLLTTPNGVVDMSVEIDDLVETSLNLGILMTEADKIVLQYALRSNKESALAFLEDKLSAFASYNGCRFEISGQYAPWEFKKIHHSRNYMQTPSAKSLDANLKSRPFMLDLNVRCLPKKSRIWIVLR